MTKSFAAVAPRTTIMRAISACVALGGIAVGASASASGHSGPTVTVFDAPGAGTGANQGTFAADINCGGTVVGYTIDDNDVYHGFVRAGTAIKILDAPGAGAAVGSAQGTVAYTINSSGTIAGLYEDVNDVTHGFVRWPWGSYTSFDAPGAGTGAGQGTFAVAINDLGTVTGYYADENTVYHGFVRDPFGKVTSFEAPGAGTSAQLGTVVSLENGINLEGGVTGWYFDDTGTPHGYERSPSGVSTSFDPPGAAQTYVGAITDLGVIAGGEIDDNQVFHGYVRSASGAFTTFDAPGAGSTAGNYQGTFAVDITDTGESTGYDADDNTVYHGWVRTAKGAIQTIDIAGAGTSAPQGTVPQALNAAGEIVGYFEDGSDISHGFVRTP